MGQLAETSESLHGKSLVRMESALPLWIVDTRKKDVSLDNNMIGEKAKEVHKTTATDNQDDRDPGEPQPPTEESSMSAPSAIFQASKRWFNCLLKRFHLHSVTLHGEAGSADHSETAADPPCTTAKIN